MSGQTEPASPIEPATTAGESVIVIAATAEGARVAARLPYRYVPGRPAELFGRFWQRASAFVVIMPAGAAVRLIAPHLESKHSDPAVLCVDSRGGWVVPLTGAHEAGGNELAAEVAGLLGATPVITTGDPPAVIPGAAAARPYATTHRAHIAGVGCATGCTPEELTHLLETTLAEAGLDRTVLESVATVDIRANHPAVRSLGLPVRSYPADTLDRIQVPTPSDAVFNAVGTHSVAEASAIISAGPGGRLVVKKTAGQNATVALALRHASRGVLSIVGLGPGDGCLRTPAATEALQAADVVIGYAGYIDLCDPILGERQEVLRFPIGAERERVRVSLELATEGRRVAIISSGDPGVYAMASAVFEELAAWAPDGAPASESVDDITIKVIPGVSAAQAAAGLLGSPLGHDHCYISLSDLLTPWDVIESRLAAAASTGMVIALYNPASQRRTWQLPRARDVLAEYLPADTPVSIVDNAARPGQRAVITTIGDLDTSMVTMASTVVVGPGTTIEHPSAAAGSFVFAPRGYAQVPSPEGTAVSRTRRTRESRMQ